MDNVIWDGFSPEFKANSEIRRLFRNSNDDILKALGLESDVDFWKGYEKWRATHEAKYLDALMDQKMKLNPGMDAERALMDGAIKYRTALHDQQNKVGKVIDFATKKQEMTPKGIPWSNIGMKILRHPITRGIGVAGDVALGGMALSDVIFGTSSVGNSMRGINEMMNVPYKDDGTVQTNIPAYRDQRSRLGLPTKTSQPFRDFTQTDYGKAFNRGGIASLV